jgi:hypothetical protein
MLEPLVEQCPPKGKPRSRICGARLRLSFGGIRAGPSGSPRPLS